MLAYSGIFLAREYTKVDTFVGMGDIWSFLIINNDPPSIFTEVAKEDFTGPPYPVAGDSLLEVEGLPANAANYFSVFNPNTPAGQVVAIRFTHDGQILDNTVMTRSIPNMLRVQVIALFIIRTILTATLIFVGFWAFLRMPSSSSVQILALFCFCTVNGLLLNRTAVAEGYATFQIPYQNTLNLFFLTMSVFSPVFFLKLQLVFPRVNQFYDSHRNMVNALIFLPGLAGGALVVWKGNAGALPLAINQTALFAIGFGVLLKNYIRADSFLARRQTRLLLWGSVCGLIFYIAIPLVILLAPAWYAGWSTLTNFYVFNVTFVLLLLVPVSFAYAFGRYRLLEVEAKVKRGTRVVAVNVAFLVLFFGILYTFGELLLKQFDVESRTPTLVVGLVLAMGFIPAQRKVRDILEERFYPEKERLRNLLRDFLQSAERIGDTSSFWTGLAERLSAGLSTAEITPVLRTRDPGAPGGSGEGEFSPFESLGELVGKLGSGDHPLLVDEVLASGRVKLGEEQKEWFAESRAAVILPLVAGSGTAGYLLLGVKRNGEDYAPEELDLLRNLAAQIALVAENLDLLEEKLEKQKLEEQLLVARQIQEGLLPGELPHTPGLELAARIKFCLDVAGDYYDVIPLKNGNTLIAIGDVAGKGVGAALLMSNLQASLRTVKDVGISLTEVVRRINALIFENTPTDLFITLFVAVVNPRRGEITYVNAGHNFPVLARADGRVERLDTGGLLLGVLSSCDYEEETVPFARGDTLLMFTDGVSEAMTPNDEEFGEERIACMTSSNAGASLKKLLEKIEREVEIFTGVDTFSDDFTLLAATPV